MYISNLTTFLVAHTETWHDGQRLFIGLQQPIHHFLCFAEVEINA